MRRTFIAFVLVVTFTFNAVAQETQKTLSLDDVLRRGQMYSPRGMAGLAWTPDGKSATFIERQAGGAAWVKMEIESGTKTTLVTDAALSGAAKKAGLEGVSIASLLSATWRPDGASLWLFDGKDLSVLELAPLALKKALSLPDDVQAAVFNEAHTHAAYVKDFDIAVTTPDGRTVQVTRGGFKDMKHGLSASREEFGIKDGLWWDPTGRRIAYFCEDLRVIEPYPYVDWSKSPAEAVGGRYPMAGKRGSVVTIGVYDTRDDSTIRLETDTTIDEYLTNVTFDATGDKIYVAHVARTQDTCELVAYDAKTGKRIASLIKETDPHWIEPESGPIAIPDSTDFLWFSYKNGFRHLYRHAADGHLMRQMTHGDFDVAAFKGFTAKKDAFYFESTGTDPRQKHLFRCELAATDAKVTQPEANKAAVEMPASKITQITQGRGQHDAVVAANDAFVLDRHSNFELPMAVDLLTGDGKVVKRLFEAANPLANVKRGKAEFFTAKSPIGGDLYGHVIYPPDMKEGAKYPVLIYVYGGPHVQIVQDTWMLGPGSRNLWLDWMATQGFIVLRVDNHGTPNRGIAWEHAVHRRLGTVEVQDQVAALDWVIAQGHADPARVGVHGWSFGGFMTLSLMSRAGDRFKCGISGAPVTDWKFYETGYGERYMDTPAENPDGYKEAAVQSHVTGIKGHLLLVQGTSDDTVVWQHTIDFTQKCVQAGVDFDYFVYPGNLHGLTPQANDHFMRKMTKFFIKEL